MLLFLSEQFSHNHDIIYHGNCAENVCPDNYVGETARRISDRVLDHTGKVSIAIFINTLSRQVIKLSREVITELSEMNMRITGTNER